MDEKIITRSPNNPLIKLEQIRQKVYMLVFQRDFKKYTLEFQNEVIKCYSIKQTENQQKQKWLNDIEGCFKKLKPLDDVLQKLAKYNRQQFQEITLKYDNLEINCQGMKSEEEMIVCKNEYLKQKTQEFKLLLEHNKSALSNIPKV